MRCIKVGLFRVVTGVFCAWFKLRKHPIAPKVLKGLYVNSFQHYAFLTGEQYFGQEGHSKRRNMCRPSYKQYVVYVLLCVIDDNTVVSGANKEALKLFAVDF
jgi:hypothetical protein